MNRLIAFVLCLVALGTSQVMAQDPKPKAAAEPKTEQESKPLLKQDSEHLSRLIGLLTTEDANANQRANACESIGKYGRQGKPAVPALLAFIDGQLLDSAVVQRSYYYTDRKSIVLLVYPSGTTARTVKAVNALAEIGPDAKAAIPGLIKLTALKFAEVAKDAAAAKDAPDAKPSKPLRAAAAVALGKVGGADAVAALTTLLNTEKDQDTRLGAVEGLAVVAKSSDEKLALESQAQLKVVAETDESKAVRDAADTALKALTDVTEPKK